MLPRKDPRPNAQQTSRNNNRPKLLTLHLLLDHRGHTQTHMQYRILVNKSGGVVKELIFGNSFMLLLVIRYGDQDSIKHMQLERAWGGKLIRLCFCN